MMKTAVARFLAVLSCALCIIDLSFRYWDQRLTFPGAAGLLNILSKMEFLISTSFSRRRRSQGSDRLGGVVITSGTIVKVNLCHKIENSIMFMDSFYSKRIISHHNCDPLIHVDFQLAEGSRRLIRDKGLLSQDNTRSAINKKSSESLPVNKLNPEPEKLSSTCFQPVDKSKSVPVYWINLQKSNMRRKYYALQMDSMGLSNLKLNAVTPANDIVKKTTITVIPRVLHTQVELSCVVSHLLAIYTAVHDENHKSNPYALITEDDVHYEMDVDFLTMAENAPKGFGSLQLITSSSVHVTNYWSKYKEEARLKMADKKSKSYGKIDNELMWTLRKHDSPYWSTQAYLISKKVVQPFIDSVVTYNNTTKTYAIDIVNPSNEMFPCPGNKDCYLPYRIVADTYLYAGCSPTYLTKIPIFNGAQVGENSTIHKRKNNNVYHAKAFTEISKVLKNVRNSTDILPPYIRVKNCDIPVPESVPPVTRNLTQE